MVRAHVCVSFCFVRCLSKYVLGRALAMGLKPIVVLNKCDTSHAISQLDNGTTEQALRQLFETLQKDSSSSSIDYVTMYASARQGWVTEEDPFSAMELAESTDYNNSEFGMHKLLDVIVREIPEPVVRLYTAEEDSQKDGSAL